MKKTIGGDRLGSGNKMQVDLRTYERSTHDLGYVWRSSMSAGTLVPYMAEVGLPGDTFDIELDLDVKTLPTVGPLFGSFKAQMDVFIAPIRLYQAQLHNNDLGVGKEMSKIKLPQIEIEINKQLDRTKSLDNQQINPSCIFSYLNIRGIGTPTGPQHTRQFNGIPYIAYWDIYKNYYANKQEEIGAVIHSESTAIIKTVTSITAADGGNPVTLTFNRPSSGGAAISITAGGGLITILYTGAVPKPEQIYLNVSNAMGTRRVITELFNNIVYADGRIYITGAKVTTAIWGWTYQDGNDLETEQPNVYFFPLKNIDDMRTAILRHNAPNLPFVINKNASFPYSLPLQINSERATRLNSQEGLAIKTYQSDLFNNWMSTEWIDGENGINAITAIDTSSGEFTIDTLQLSKKVYDMLNRIAISGGTYDDWLDVVYTHDRVRQMSTPMYMGGLIKELVFQEVTSNAEANDPAEGRQPLGTLAGKGIMSNKHKGGRITIKVDEPSYVIGIVSLTPRIDYSQGNKWDVNLKTMDDFHKPALDEIGFQDLITEQMAWWDTKLNTDGSVIQRSAGKQPAWLNYMTNVNQIRGNFAIDTQDGFMILDRRYEHTDSDPDEASTIKDLTTYIDPVKYNHIFAQTSRDAQNFWVQIKTDITARRKMSAKLMPNL